MDQIGTITSYSSVHSIDLSLFLYHLANRTHRVAIKDICAQLRSIINLIVTSNFCSDDRAFLPADASYGSFGIAIYFPKHKEYLDKAYTIENESNNDKDNETPVPFVKDSYWDNFLLAYFNQQP